MDDFEKMSENAESGATEVLSGSSENELEVVQAQQEDEASDFAQADEDAEIGATEVLSGSSENELEVVQAQQNGEDDELYKELEGIRDMFQHELDHETQIYLAGGDLQGSDENSAESEEKAEISEDMLCECCGERERDLTEGEDYPYCSECKELMRSYPLGAKGILTVLAILVVACASLLLNFSANADIIDKAVTAKDAVSQGKLYTGLYSYYGAINSLDSSSAVPKKLIARCSKVFAQLNDYNSAVAMAEQYLDESTLNSKRFSFIKDYENKNETITAIENIIYDPLSSSETTAADAQGLCDSLEALKNDSENDYDPYYIDYYKYVVKNTLGVSKQEVYDDLKEMDEKYPDEWVHVYDLCDAAAKLGDAENAEKYFERLKKANREEASAYTCYANLYRFGENVDTEKLRQLAEEGFEAQGSFSFAASANLYRIQAVSYLLDGDNEKAYEAAENMYNVVVQNSYSVNSLFPCLYTYALASYLAGEQDSYDNVVGLLEYNSYSMSQQVLGVISGDLTVEEILTDAEGDLA